MMKRNILLALTLLALPFAALADINLPAKVEVSRPVELNTTSLRKEVAKRVEREKTGKFDSKTGFWDVFSDRDDNTTYLGPSTTSGKYKSLKFNDRVRIAKIQNGWALVYKDAPRTQFPAVSKTDAESMGWVPMDNLVLWMSCPMDERGIYEKALIIANVDELGVDSDVTKLQNLTRSFTDKSKDFRVTAQNIYYVIKEKNDMVLLAMDYRLDGTYSDKTLVGWAKKSSYTPWNQRSCLEPNFNPRKIISELDGLRAETYPTPDLNGQVQSYWEFDKDFPERMNKDSFRFPILNNDTGKSNIYKVTVFGSGGNMNAVAGGTKRSQEALNKFMETTNNINLILVIDGTTSMEPYYREVKNAIKNSLVLFGSNSNIKVGVVIYRDLADGPDAAIEVLPMTNIDSPQFSAFLDSGGKYGVKSSPNDKTAEEDMFLGLETALDYNRMGYKPNQSNLILLVGDCGNAPDLARQEAIAKKLAANGIQMMSFQTASKTTSSAYDWFSSQCSRIMKDNLDLQFRQLEANAKKAGKKELVLNGKWRPLSDDTGYQYRYNNSDDAQLFLGMTRTPAGQVGTLGNQELEHMVRDNLGDFAQTVQARLDALTQAANGVITFDSPEASVNSAWLISQLGEKNARYLLDKGAALAYTGYTKMATPSGTALWEPVIFISQDELNTLLGTLKPAYNVARQAGNERRPYVEALEGIVKAMDPSAQTGETNLAQITALIAGLNVQTKATGDRAYTLNDLMDPKVVNEDTYKGILDAFKTRYQKLEEIKKNYEFVRKFNGSTYYWIPVYELP